MLDVLRFWCERRADGFRIDALRQLIKDDRRRDNPPNPAFRDGDDPYSALVPEFTTDRPEVQDAIRDMRAAVGDERLLIGELYLPIKRLVAYYDSGLDMPANFHLLSTPWKRARSPSSSSATRPRCPPAPGRTGCWATTTARAWRPGSGLAGTCRRVPAADAARHADALLRRRARDARRRDRARAARGPVALRQPRPGRTPMQWDAEGSFTGGDRGCRRARPPDPQRRRQREDPDSLLSLLPRPARPAPQRARPGHRRHRTLSADGDVLRFARGASLEVRDRLRRRRRRDPQARGEGPRSDRVTPRLVKGW